MSAKTYIELDKETIFLASAIVSIRENHDKEGNFLSSEITFSNNEKKYIKMNLSDLKNELHLENGINAPMNDSEFKFGISF
jgi:hypothetical protein